MTVTIKDPTRKTTKKPEVGKAYRGAETGHLYLCVRDHMRSGDMSMVNITNNLACVTLGEYIEVDLEVIVK